MKTIYKITFGILCICGLLLGACTDFEELNTDPSKSSSTDPNQQLSMIQLQTWGHWQMCQPYPFYLAAFAQYMQGDWKHMEPDVPGTHQEHCRHSGQNQG